MRKIGSDPVLLGELSDLLAHELDQPEADPKLTQYVALDAGGLPHARSENQHGPEDRSARAAGTCFVDQVRDADPDCGRRQPGQASGAAGRQARRPGRRESPGRGGCDRRARSAPNGRLRTGVFRRRAAAEHLRDRIEDDEDRFVRYNAAVALARRGDPAAAATLREMLSTADLDKVIDIPSDTEKQNKIEAIELEALAALRTSISSGSPELARSLEEPITRAFQVGAGQRSKPGARALAKFTKQALNYRACGLGRPTVVPAFTPFVKGLT